MLRRILCAVPMVIGVALAALAVVVAPAASLSGVVVALFIGAVAAFRNSVVSSWDGDVDVASAMPPSRARWHDGLRAGLTTIAAWLVVIGIVVLLLPSPGEYLLLTVAMIGATVWLWRRSTYPAAEVDPVAPARPVTIVAGEPIRDDATIRALCAAWQRSYFTLLDFPPGPGRYEIVCMRARLLDEIERRDAAGFGRWLESGARAGSDPGRYLASDR